MPCCWPDAPSSRYRSSDWRCSLTLPGPRPAFNTSSLQGNCREPTHHQAGRLSVRSRRDRTDRGVDRKEQAWGASAATACASGTVSYWYDPMVPAQHFEKPGKSPFMDMQLVPKCAQGTPNTADGGSVAVDPRVVQNLGVRIAPVERERIARLVDSVGLVSVDEHRIQTVQVRASGWVEQLAVRAAGDAVHHGQLLAAVYSPELLAAQDELLIAVGSGDAGLLAATRSRLELLGMSGTQIARVEKTRKTERRV